jgi:hypothetical protein
VAVGSKQTQKGSAQRQEGLVIAAPTVGRLAGPLRQVIRHRHVLCPDLAAFEIACRLNGHGPLLQRPASQCPEHHSLTNVILPAG